MEINKVILISDPEADFGQYFLWRGLVQLLGDENVVTFPFKKTYYGEVDNDYILPDGKKGFTAPYDFQDIVPRIKPKVWTLDEVCDKIYSFDLVIFSSLRKYAQQGYNDIKNKLGTFPCPIVYIDNEDYSGMNMWVIDQIKPYALFKRELLRGEPYPSHYPLFPLPFSCNIEENQFPEQEKEYDVFFACGITYPVRQEIINKLNEISAKHGIKFLGGGNEFRRSWKEYHECMEKSKICIVARGWGWDTVRAWEAPAHRTMTMWLEHHQIIPHPFEDKKHVVHFNLNNLEELVLYYLKNDEERILIAKQGREHLFAHHTNKKRCEYMLSKIKEIGG